MLLHFWLLSLAFTAQSSPLDLYAVAGIHDQLQQRGLTVAEKAGCAEIRGITMPNGIREGALYIGRGENGCVYVTSMLRDGVRVRVAAKTPRPLRDKYISREIEGLKRVNRFYEYFVEKVTARKWVLMPFVPGVRLRLLTSWNQYIGNGWHRDPKHPRELCETYMERIYHAIDQAIFSAANDHGVKNLDLHFGNFLFEETWPDATRHGTDIVEQEDLQMPMIKASIVDWGSWEPVKKSDAIEITVEYSMSLRTTPLRWKDTPNGQSSYVCDESEGEWDEDDGVISGTYNCEGCTILR
ncbi:hypothetical protein FRC03_005817 [Tulasnella sp. 419]|nr:hypothetical protein FRC03_005817 [Tulasnella sp. 419]